MAKIENIPCQTSRRSDGSFLPSKDMYIVNIGANVGGCVLSRYYKGIEGGREQRCDCENNKRVIELGFIDKGTGKHQSNVVYSIEAIAPCVVAMFGVKQPPTMIVVRSENEQISGRIKREH